MTEITTRSAPDVLEAIQKVLAENGVAALITLVDRVENVGAKMLVSVSGVLAGGLGNDALGEAASSRAIAFLLSKDNARLLRVHEFAPELSPWGEAQILFERIQPEPEIVICGAGHVGASLAKLAVALNYQVTLIDDRIEFLNAELFPKQGIKLVLADRWADAVRAATGDGRGVSVTIVTRGHQQDEECMRAIVETTPDYVGLIGSKRRTKIVLERLRTDGVAEEKLQRVHAPIGLDIGAVTPEEVALAILAEIVAERRGGKGGPLSASKINR